jgi:hypothetical protein
MYFFVPDNWEKYHKIENGRKMVRNSNSCWFTNLEVKKHNEELVLFKKYSRSEYPKYDNYDAINIDNVNEIPCDYNEKMGVPITFIDKYNPDQFEIIGFTHRNDPYKLKTKIYTKKDGEKFNDLNGSPVIKLGKEYKYIYMRIIIKKKMKGKSNEN